MTEIKILHKSANEIMEIVKEVRAMGLVQGKDFNFAFYQATWNDSTFEAVSPKHTIFTFYEERWATLFSLKWGSK